MTQKWAYWEPVYETLHPGLQLTFEQRTISLMAGTPSPTEASLQLQKPQESQDCR